MMRPGARQLRTRRCMPGAPALAHACCNTRRVAVILQCRIGAHLVGAQPMERADVGHLQQAVTHAALLRVARATVKPAFLEVDEGLHQFLLGVHHERAVPHHRLVERAARHQDQLRAVGTGP